MERCLVTGSNGLIGKRLMARLKNLGHTCRPLARSEWVNPEQVVWGFLPTMIFHLAAYGNHSWQTDTDEIYHTNIFKLLTLLEACKILNLKAFVNVGSSSEYGIKDKPMKEDMALEPTTHYAASKAAGTMICRAWAAQAKMPIVTVRPFSVYGPGEDSRRFIPTIIDCAITGKTLQLAPGVHDWIYADDVVDGMILVSQKARELAGQAVNLGTGTQWDNDAVVDVVRVVTKREIHVEYLEKKIRSYDTYDRWAADISLVRSLGWNPQVELHQGIKRVYESIKKSNSGN
mgnify:CR=1 FL=1